MINTTQTLLKILKRDFKKICELNPDWGYIEFNLLPETKIENSEANNLFMVYLLKQNYIVSGEFTMSMIFKLTIRKGI